MRLLFSCLLFLVFSTTAFAQQSTTSYQDNRIINPRRTLATLDGKIVLPYEVSPCADVSPVFFLRVDDAFSITGVGTVAQGDVLEGKAAFNGATP